MSYNVRLYHDTGYNSINCPDSPSRLEGKQYVTLTPSEIIQPYRLSTITVQANYDTVMNADYLELYDTNHKAFYSVDSFEMTSPDVAVLGVTMDYTLTLMALEGYTSMDQIPFLDGITERHHVPKNDDIFGDFCEDDNLLCPSKSLEVVSSADLMADPGNQGTITVVESRIDLNTPGSAATTYEDPVTTEKVTIPNMEFVQSHGTVAIYDPGRETTINVVNPSAEYYRSDNSQAIRDNITKAQNLNLEGGILASWVLPGAACHATAGASGTVDLRSSQRSADPGASLNFEYRNVANKRALYGKTTKYVLFCPASGSQAEFDPEDICKNGGSNITRPSVEAAYDVRSDGRPYYRFKYYRGESSNFWMNAIPGQQWATAPINFSQKPGISLDTAKFETAQQMAVQGIQNSAELTNLRAAQMNTNLQMDEGLDGNSGFGRAFDVAGLAGQFGSGNIMGGIQGAYNAEMNRYNRDMGYLQQNRADAQALQMKKMAYGQELQQFALDTKFVVPNIAFPRSNTIRDILGNGVRVVRINPQASDTAKFDKILNMYGYRVTEALQGSFFTNRSKYNYVKAVGVAIGGTAPKWLREGAAAELAVGKRVWHVAPDPALYTGSSNN